jgi:hypothetical protein
LRYFLKRKRGYLYRCGLREKVLVPGESENATSRATGVLPLYLATTLVPIP